MSHACRPRPEPRTKKRGTGNRTHPHIVFTPATSKGLLRTIPLLLIAVLPLLAQSPPPTPYRPWHTPEGNRCSSHDSEVTSQMGGQECPARTNAIYRRTVRVGNLSPPLRSRGRQSSIVKFSLRYRGAPPGDRSSCPAHFGRWAADDQTYLPRKNNESRQLRANRCQKGRQAKVPKT